MQARAGVILGAKYELVAPLGRGGMGEVWRARALDLDAPVAIKLLLDAAATPSARARFEREAKAAAALRSPHVVQVLGYGVDEPSSTPFIVLELLEGETLRQRLQSRGRLSANETQRWVTHIARALTRAHASGIVHRDLKPDNVFLVDNGDEQIAKVLDFGVAKQSIGSLHTASGTVLGTIHYMAPEQLEGRSVDHRADLWSLTLLAAECLTGERAVEGQTFGEVVTRVVLGRVRTPSTLAPVPAGFDEWFARGTRLQPAERFASAEELAQELAQISMGRGTAVPLDAPSSSAEPPLVVAPPAPEGALAATVHDGVAATALAGEPAGVRTSAASSDRSSRVALDVRVSPESIEALSMRPARPAAPLRRLRIWAALGSTVSLIAIGWVLARRPPEGPALPAAIARLEPKAPAMLDSPVIAATPSVALLPFEVKGGSDATRYFADGVHADLLERLGGVSGLRVASREVVVGYRGSEANAAQIALELHVQHVVRTQLELHGATATWRVRAHDAHGREAWSRTYERALDDAVGTLSALSSDLVEALSPRLSASERQRLAMPASVSARAYELYLESQSSDLTYENRERLLSEAVQLDPRFARAWLDLAELRSSFYQWNIRHTPEQLDAASFALGKAQGLAPDDPEVRQLVAWSYGSLYRDWPRAYRDVTALAQDYPNSGALQYMLSRVAERRGDPQRAADHSLRAWELDPARDDYGWWLAYDQTQLRRYSEARQTLQRVKASAFHAEAGRDFDLARLDFIERGNAEALHVWARGLSSATRVRPEVRARLLDMAWELGEAETLLTRAPDMPDDVVDVPLRQIFFGIASLERGDREAALRWLDRAEQTLRAELAVQPDNARTHARLGLLLSVRGGAHERALDHAKRALRLVPQNVDAYSGAQLRAAYTCTLAWLGERDAAVRELQLAIARPYPEDHSFFFPLHVEHLKVGIEWKPLRGLRAFEALLEAPESRVRF